MAIGYSSQWKRSQAIVCIRITRRVSIKARVFRAILGITIENADQLVALIQQAAVEGEVVQRDLTPEGEIFKVDWEIPNTDGEQPRSTWEIAHDSDAPRLVTAFIK